MQYELTDPALELAGMAKWILDLPGSPGPLGAQFSLQLGLNSGSTGYLTLLAETCVRLDRMERFVSSIHDVELSNKQKGEVVEACRQLRGFFHPFHQERPFDQIRANFVRPADALHLSMFHHIARRYRPLRRVTEGERAKTLSSIDEAIAKIASDAELPDWARPMLSDGLARIKLCIEFLPFFGHDAAFNALLLLDQQNQGIIEVLKANAISGGQAVFEVAKIIATVVSLFNAPVTVHNSYVEYRGVLTKLLSEHHQPLALPKPSKPSEADTLKSKIEDTLPADV